MRGISNGAISGLTASRRCAFRGVRERVATLRHSGIGPELNSSAKAILFACVIVNLSLNDTPIPAEIAPLSE
jgi:hypothetical protein